MRVVISKKEMALALVLSFPKRKCLCLFLVFGVIVLKSTTKIKSLRKMEASKFVKVKPSVMYTCKASTWEAEEKEHCTF